MGNTTADVRTATQWTIDSAHSLVEFAVKHMMFTTAKGRFNSLEGTIQFNEADPAAARVEAVIHTNSISTGDEKRDAHLRSADFFDAEKYPTIEFHSKRVEHDGENSGRIVGDLTMHGITREVVLETEYEGQLTDSWGKRRAAFSAETEVNRKDFGLNWNVALESGGVMVSERVKIALSIAATLDE